VRLEQLLLLLLAAAFCLAMGIALCVALVVVYFWDTHRLLTVAILAAGFLAAGVVLGLNLRDKANARAKPFAITRGELTKDRAMLRGPKA